MPNPSTILIVDDVEKNRKLLHGLIVSLGHTPILAENGVSALEQMEKQLPDIVLLDILMPEMDGYEVLDSMKDSGKLCHIPVIMITAVEEMESAVRCIEKGAEDYLIKPFNPTLLKARINGSLEKQHCRNRERRLYAELQQNFESLQRAEQARDGLFHMIIHDLNNPLMSVLGLTEVFLEDVLNKDIKREWLAKNYKVIFHAAEEMSCLIKGILDLSKLEAGKMAVSLTSLHVVRIISDVFECFVPMAEKKGVKLSFESQSEDFIVQADKALLPRILQNLLANALKYTPGGTEIKISLVRHGKDAIISIADDGPGIPGKYKDKVFEKFFQDETGKEVGKYGVGLGLTFCKMAVEAQGGRIWVESREGEGACFKVALEGV